MTLALSWALAFGCAAITDADLAARMDRDGDGDLATQWGGVDCDDQDPHRHIDATETCNGLDDDCNGAVDDVTAPEGSTFYLDLDHDKVGGPEVQACEPPKDAVAVGGDCDDDDALVHPGVAEVCNGYDDDCDGLVDDADDLETQTWYGDADDDGYGFDTIVKVVAGCTVPDGYAAAGGDCDDGRPEVNPDAQEVCNALDDDCDGDVDAADDSLDGTTYYEDGDNDGFGTPLEDPIVACERPLGYAAESADCDDGDAAVNPEAVEVCNGRDDNCVKGEDDATDLVTWYLDADGDTYGGATSIEACDRPAGDYVRADGDCDDGDVAYNPGADECGEVLDYNCDGSTGDEDADGDGYQASCDDCNDDDAAINPAADEECDDGDVDENCNDLADDDDETTQDWSKTAWYPDDDGDLYGDALAAAVRACTAPPDTVTDHTDCDDGNDDIHPGAAEEWYNGIDENCSGESDSDYDRDGDGDEADSEGGTDCDDGDASVHVGAPDAWYDGEDTNCDGRNDYDKDGDSYPSDAYGGTDCDDDNAGINPGATENTLTLTVDEDCDGNNIL
jgi:hypothetical protein